jgi:hypothetical protein
MADFPTRAQLFQVGADEMIGRGEARPPGSRVSTEEIFTEGSDVNMQLAAASAMGEEVLRHLALRVGALFLGTAEGEDLDRFIADRFSGTIARLDASAALVDMSVSQVPTGPAQSFPVGTRFKTTAGIEYRSLIAGSLAALDPGPVTIRCQAVETGPAGNVDAGVINALVQPVDGVTVTNPARASGGDDIEPDGRLRERARDFYRVARRGTLAAIEFGGRTVAGVRLATALESVDGFGNPTGHVSLFISDAVGSGNAALADLVADALVEWRAAGIWVDVFGATPRFEAIQYRLRFEAGVDSTLAFSAVRDRALASVNRLAPQKTLERSLLFEAPRQVPGVIVLNDAVVVPVGDIVPAAGEIIRTRIDLITAV